MKFTTEDIRRMVAYVPLHNEEGEDVGYFDMELKDAFEEWLKAVEDVGIQIGQGRR